MKKLILSLELILTYYPSDRVKALPAYDGDYSFEDINLFPSISELIAEFEKKVKQFDKNNEDTNINGYLDSVETFIIAEKLNKMKLLKSRLNLFMRSFTEKILFNK